MQVLHTSSIASGMSSLASIEHLGSYQDNLEFYQENKFTYIPMPFEDKYYNREKGKVQAIKPQQFVKEDATIRRTLDHLQDYPFLLIQFDYTFYLNNNGELVVGSINIPDDWEHLGTAEDVFNSHTHLLDELINICREKMVFRIITLADVNRRTVKEALYPVIAELETRFVDEIRNSDLETQDLYKDLSVETIERREKAKMNGIQMEISEYMKLSEMMKVIGKSETLRENFGYSSRSQFDNDLGGLIELRNKIMHATRTLVNDRSELEKLVSRISRAESAIEYHGGSVKRGHYDKIHYG